MNPLLAALTLFVTITAALAAGVLLAYASVSAILHAMHRPEPAVEQTMAATEASGGD